MVKRWQKEKKLSFQRRNTAVTVRSVFHVWAEAVTTLLCPPGTWVTFIRCCRDRQKQRCAAEPGQKIKKRLLLCRATLSRPRCVFSFLLTNSRSELKPWSEHMGDCYTHGHTWKESCLLCNTNTHTQLCLLASSPKRVERVSRLLLFSQCIGQRLPATDKKTLWTIINCTLLRLHKVCQINQQGDGKVELSCDK